MKPIGSCSLKDFRTLMICFNSVIALWKRGRRELSVRAGASSRPTNIANNPSLFQKWLVLVKRWQYKESKKKMRLVLTLFPLITPWIYYYKFSWKAYCHCFSSSITSIGLYFTGISFRVPLSRQFFLYHRDLSSRIGASFGRSKRPFNGNVLTCFQ